MAKFHTMDSHRDALPAFKHTKALERWHLSQGHVKVGNRVCLDMRVMRNTTIVIYENAHLINSFGAEEAAVISNIGPPDESAVSILAKADEGIDLPLVGKGDICTKQVSGFYLEDPAHSEQPQVSVVRLLLVAFNAPMLVQKQLVDDQPDLCGNVDEHNLEEIMRILNGARYNYGRDATLFAERAIGTRRAYNAARHG